MHPQPGQYQSVTYLVDTLRETLVGGKTPTADLQNLLNQRAYEGWTLKSTTSASVKGRLGPGSTDGLVLIFERPLYPPS